MRLVWICAFVWLAVPSAFGEGITIVLDFQGPRSEQSVAEMKREFAGIMKDTAVRFDFRSRSQASQEALSDLVLVRFTGKYMLDPLAYLSDERGPMAFINSTTAWCSLSARWPAT